MGIVERINDLAIKEKEQGLTEEEKAEQEALREQYLSMFRNNFREQLDNIDIENPDGSIENLGEMRERGIREVFEEGEAESDIENSSDSDE